MSGVGYFENERFKTVSEAPGGVVSSIGEETRGDIGIANEDLGLIRVAPDGASEDSSAM